jgi:hypothetical protein
MSGYPKGQYNIEICNPLNVCGFVQWCTSNNPEYAGNS